MNAENFEDEILREKKARFLASVKKTSKYFNVETPRVEFHEDRCPYEGPNEWAHIHIEMGIICVSKLRLRQMSYEQIDETASHEVTHLIDPTHNTSFYATQDNARLGTWEPPGGVYVGGGLDSEEAKKRIVKKKVNKKECSRFDCSKRTEFEKCQYCGLNFCPKHVTPRPVGLPEFKSNNARDKLFMIEWHKEGGHPCPDYMEYWEADQKSKEERYRRNLDIFLRSKQKVPVITVGLSKAQMRKNNKRTEKQTKLIAKQEPIIKEQKEKTEIKEEIKVKEKEQPKKSKKIVIIGVIILVLIVIFVTLFVYKFTISKEIDVNETKTIFVTKNITRQIPIKTSFEEYFNQLDYYTTMDVTIEGSLYNPAEGSATAGVYVYYISDDYGRKILLLSLNSDQKSLFIKKGITPDIYAVQGTLRRKMTGLELTVNKIDDAQRTTEEVVQPMQVAENITQTVKKLTAYNFTIIELIKEYLNK